MSRFILLIFLLFLMTAPVYAQNTTADSETKWWWAWREQTGELIAFNAEGETNVIAEIETINHFSRLNEDTALAILQTGDTFGLYKLTSQASIQLDYQVDGVFEGSFDSNKSGSYLLLIVEDNYAVISGSAGREWLFNMVTNTLDPLDQPLHTSNHCGYDISGLPYGMEACLRFSEDGRYLRYVADISAESNDRFALRERDLATGEEENFYIPVGLPGEYSTNIDCESGAYGVQWLCYRYSEFDTYTVVADWLVNRRGQTRTLMEESLSGGFGWARIYLSRDDLVILNNQCEQACWIDIIPSTEIFAQRFALTPDGPQPYMIRGVTLLSNGNLLLSANSKKYVLNATGELQELGAIYCCEVLDTTSPDYRWIIVATDQGATIWDLESNQAKFTVPTSLPITLYTSKGFVINNRWVYFNGDESLLELSIDENGGFVDMLPERTLLYEQSEANDELARGIYRYDPETDTYTVLVAEATIAWAQNLHFGQKIMV